MMDDTGSFSINFVWLHCGSGHIATSGGPRGRAARAAVGVYGYKTLYRFTSSTIKSKEKK
jgi:hypothetical protein